MPAFAALSLLNISNNPVVFAPQSKDANGVSLWLGPETELDAKSKITQSVNLPKNGSPVTRVKQRIILPVMDSLDPTKKITEAYADVVYVLPKQASENTRLNLRKLVGELSGHTMTIAAVRNYEDNY